MSDSTRWSLSPYPAGRHFAFTLIHDADGSYSQRLAPLFEVFDEVSLKLTVTVFSLWAEWAREGAIWSEWLAVAPEQQLWEPLDVPLEDEREREFYLGLAQKGHEIAMHAASETSDTRESLLRALELFRQIFGRPPRTYVEHSSGNNLDAQRREGSRPGSAYFNNDLLQDRCDWVWLDDALGLADPASPMFYDIRACLGSPFRPPEQSFGLRNAFLRSGRWGRGNGDGFLETYTVDRILELEKNRGLALVYTHLQKGWLDRQTGRMREDLRSRLEFVASRNGWFAPAGDILDRLQAMKQVRLDPEEVHNQSTEALTELTLVSPQGDLRVLGDLAPGQVLRYASG